MKKLLRIFVLAGGAFVVLRGPGVVPASGQGGVGSSGDIICNSQIFTATDTFCQSCCLNGFVNVNDEVSAGSATCGHMSSFVTGAADCGAALPNSSCTSTMCGTQT